MQQSNAAIPVSKADSESAHVPGEAGIWVFIFGDMIIFSLFFCLFLYYRNQDAALFAKSQLTLSQGMGAINTILLLSSSWFVAKGVQGARSPNAPPSSRWFLLALLCGLGFAIIKVSEYRLQISAGNTLMSNDFYMYYFVFTGIHFLHVLIGMGVLSLMWSITRKPVSNAGDMRTLESGASFWHLVDLLWIMLFTLIYLVR